jgi:hypothetical protein
MFNKLDKSDKSLNEVYGRKDVLIAKRDQYSWDTSGPTGEFAWVDKRDLNIDERYQRDETSKSKVVHIAKHWDWLMLGVISVIRRSDKTLWVFDGGHRTRAAFYRDDVQAIPCMVHDFDDLGAEAKAFVVRNTMISNVSAVDRYKASVCAEEPTAIATKQLLEELGLEVKKTSNGKHSVKCIGAIQRIMQEDPQLARRVVVFVDKMVRDSALSSSVIRGLFLLCKHFDDIDILHKYRDKLLSFSMRDMEIRIAQVKREVGAGGEKVEALGVMACINKGLKNKLKW